MKTTKQEILTEMLRVRGHVANEIWYETLYPGINRWCAEIDGVTYNLGPNYELAKFNIETGEIHPLKT